MYGNLIDATAYHEARNNQPWLVVTDARREAALLIASEWIDGKWRNDFPGYRATYRDQMREWPRTAAIDVYGVTIDPLTVPYEIENATYETALREIIKPGALNVDFTLSGYIKQVSVDGAVSVTYAGANDVGDAQLIIPNIAAILYPILLSNSQSGKLSGLAIRS